MNTPMQLDTPSLRRSDALVPAGILLAAAAAGIWLWVGRNGATALQRATAADSASSVLEPYPPGRWRLQNPVGLQRVMLWVSHILIQHEGSPGREVSFAPSQWQSQAPPPVRTREEARQLAVRVAAEAVRSPEAFARLAAQYSEDIVTKDSGGSLGGISASQFFEEPQVLDALSQTPPGTLTRPVETRYGFHVFLRRAPPEESVVSGAHIVIGHDDAR